jgi:hypothetical protein
MWMIGFRILCVLVDSCKKKVRFRCSLSGSEAGGMLRLAATALVLAAGPELRVTEGGGGDASTRDIAAVLRSAAEAFAPALEGVEAPVIEVSRGREGPITLYARGPKGEFRVRLDVEGALWARFAFQFAHEYAHVLAGALEYRNPNAWFEEALCEAASLFALGRMAEAWATEPPYPNWKDYAKALGDYRLERLAKAGLPEGETLPAWFRREEASLRADAVQREKNLRAAAALLPLLEKAPGHWAALRHLNAVRDDPARSFRKHLDDWSRSAPERHRPFIRDVASLFGV